MVLNSLEKEKQFKLQEKPGKNVLEKGNDAAKETAEITKVIGAVNEGTDFLDESNEGNVGEKVSGKKEGTSGGSMTQDGNGSTASTTQVRVIPKIEIMIVEVSKAIHEELRTLEVAADKAKNPHELSLIVAKIRDWNYTLSNVGSITFEALKALWLKLIKKS